MNNELVTIGTFTDVTEAETARIYLEAEGIQSFLADEEGTGIWTGAIGTAKLQVPAARVAEASALLEAFRKESRPHDDKEETGPDVTACLACGAPLAAGETTCSKCGWSYAGGPEAEAEADDDEDI